MASIIRLKVQRGRGVLKHMTAAELDEESDQALRQQGKRFYRFLDLPPELRNRIYSLSVWPYEIKRHIARHVPPSLLCANRQIHAESRSLYYSNEFMEKEFYDRTTRVWLQVNRSLVFAFMSAPHSSRLLVMAHHSEQQTREIIIRHAETGMYKEPGTRRGPFGILKWKGATGGAHAVVEYDLQEHMREQHPRVQKADWVVATRYRVPSHASS